jgi:MOSC domain-containing protein YiiM
MAHSVVESVNVGRPRPIERRSGEITTSAIWKEPIDGRVAVRGVNVDGDDQADRSVHGGPDQAVYAYGTDDYAWWSAELGRELAPATFGENLTIDGLRSGELAVGDRLEVGADVVLEVTSPRIPCDTLAARMGERRFQRRFAAARRPGVYLRVLAPGAVETGAAVRLAPDTSSPLTVLELQDLFYARDVAPEVLERALTARLAIRARRDLERRLRRAAS